MVLMIEILYVVIAVSTVLCIAVEIITCIASRKTGASEIKQTIESTSALNKELMTAQSATISQQIADMRQDNAQTLQTVMSTVSDMYGQNADNIRAFNETLHKEMGDLRTDVINQLDVIRKTVDDQLQDNLERKLQESFRTVSEQLGAVQRGLGEMQNLAANVGDLKKSLSAVKTRGIWGEVQLGNILSEIMSPAQYDTNVITVPHSSYRVEYAIKLPGSGNDVVYLPIDSKFPGDTYNKLLDAYESGSKSNVETAWKTLESVLMKEAKDIHDKYISPPHTTEFGIMFLPIEGLYAEAVKHGLVEKMQSTYKINIAGPTTMAALLNSLQMGFKTLQIQKQSGEVWKLLQDTRIEFDKYADVLAKAQSRLKQTQEELETLVGVRTRQISSKLSQIEQYSPDSYN